MTRRAYTPAPRARRALADSYQLLLGHAPTPEDSLTLLTIASHINPIAFRDPVNGLVTPFETRAFAAGMLKSVGGRDTYRRETPDGELPSDRRGDRKKGRKPRLSARKLEVFAAKVAYTNAHPHPGHVHPRSLRDADRLGRPMKERVSAWQAGLHAAIPTAPELDA